MLSFEWIESTGLSIVLGVSVSPIAIALHVASFAFFAAFVLGEIIVPFDPGLRAWRRAGLIAMLVTGVLLFLADPVHLARSTFFLIKLALLVMLAFAATLAPKPAPSQVLTATQAKRLRAGLRRHHAVVLVLWIAVVFASRGIGYF